MRGIQAIIWSPSRGVAKLLQGQGIQENKEAETIPLLCDWCPYTLPCNMGPNYSIVFLAQISILTELGPHSRGSGRRELLCQHSVDLPWVELLQSCIQWLIRRGFKRHL